ncbi:hypothetical protein [Methanosarcina sp. KYL-1]|uniref:hypothetical protein n=1 Tax=Methanosarcina sp. KYL-1 TaxID=2602068 RepID=UPI00210142FA|nr:hypothetical protein [Methanosarcina sp. KYL-1]
MKETLKEIRNKARLACLEEIRNEKYPLARCRKVALLVGQLPAAMIPAKCEYR